MTKLTIKSDAELSAAVAEHVAGWTYWRSKHGHFKLTDPDGNSSEPAFGMAPFDSETGEKIERPWWFNADIPDFATSADAVLPLLERAPWDSTFHDGQSIHGDYMVRSNGYIARDNSFPRAACLALLHAKGFEVEFEPE